MDNLDSLHQVLAYIEEHLEEPVTAEEISAFCHYSVSNLKYLFRRVFQYGMMDYVNRRKVTEAAGELVGTNRTVCEVAYRYGFGSQAVFGRCFRKVWGESPSSYRKSHRFSDLFPRQEFFRDEVGVFRRRFDLSRLREELRRGGRRAAVCFDLVGFRELKAAWGREAGEWTALQMVWRLEEACGGAAYRSMDGAGVICADGAGVICVDSTGVARDDAAGVIRDAGAGDIHVADASIYRIAGDRFVVLTGSDFLDEVRAIVRGVLARNGEAALYRGNAIQLAAFAGWTYLEREDGENPRLFEKLEAVLLQAHDRLEIQFPETAGCHLAIRLEEGTGLYLCAVSGCRRMQMDGLTGWGARLDAARWGYSCTVLFPEGEERFAWEQCRPASVMFFPDGKGWCRETLYGETREVRQENYRIIRDFYVDDKSTAVYRELFLEVVRRGDGTVLWLNEGELKEAVGDGLISREEYARIRALGKELEAGLRGSVTAPKP